MRIPSVPLTASWLVLFRSSSTNNASAFTTTATATIPPATTSVSPSPTSILRTATTIQQASTAEDLALEIGTPGDDDDDDKDIEKSRHQHHHQQHHHHHHHTQNRPVTLTVESIGKLKWRDLQYELQARDLETAGTTAVLRDRLRESVNSVPQQQATTDGPPSSTTTGPDECPPDLLDIDYVDASDPFTGLLNEVTTEADRGYWKRATRRLKKLQRRYGATHCIPSDVYVATLQACSQDRLHGARASESARKIVESMIELGYEVPVDTFNYCVRSALGYGPNGTHEGFGGIDTALAMLSAIGQQESKLGRPLVSVETYSRIIEALAREGGSSVQDALTLLRSVVVDKRETPPLSAFAAVAYAEARGSTSTMDDNSSNINKRQQDEDITIGPENVFNVIAYVKAAGYELNTIASTEDGLRILAAGVIAAEKMNNVRLGLRLLKAASEASGCAPDRGDVLITLNSKAAQRACALLHKKAINTAVEENQWQLSVKLLQMMMERSLKPSPMVWRNVVTCCAKNEKSRKATGVLLDWVKLYEKGEAEQPPLSVFNTCVNACEICGEQELTIPVLEAMKKTHNTDGNIITFNIALKRLARNGNHWAPEGIIIGMLQNGIEPTVVSYTTAIAACAAANPKRPALAYEWIQRMRSRQVNPNVITYNTALAACLDGNFTSTQLASNMAKEMLQDVDRQLASGDVSADEYTNVFPDYSTKAIARQLMKQLKENWVKGDVDKQVAKATLRVPLLQLVEFSKSKAAAEAAEQAAKKAEEIAQQEDQLDTTSQAEVALEYSEASKAHRTAEV